MRLENSNPDLSITVCLITVTRAWTLRDYENWVLDLMMKSVVIVRVVMC